jgi:outer membrane protein OmpA-like peptidoglycan-associated protein
MSNSKRFLGAVATVFCAATGLLLTAETPVTASRMIAVFFDWQSAELTADAKAILRDTVEAARRGRSTRIELTAFSAVDESDRDRLLAARRAASVKAEIEGLGFKGEIVAIGGQAPKLPSPSIDAADTFNRRVVLRLDLLFSR